MVYYSKFYRPLILPHNHSNLYTMQTIEVYRNPMVQVYRELSVCFLSLILCATMLGVGNAYSDESDCKLKAAYFLTVAGGWGIAMNLLVILTYLYLYCNDIAPTREARLCGITEIIGNFVIFIWGSVIVFGPYQEWNHTSKTDDNYCAYTPYSFAFGVLIWNWAFIALRVVLIACEIFCWE